MTPDPASFFGGLARGCIRDRWVEDDSDARDSVIFTFLGIGSGLLTVYLLSWLGFFV